MSTDTQRIALRFEGSVQGVGFRWNSQRIARQLGLSGWVRNEYDGSVSMELQGSEDTIACFLQELEKTYSKFRMGFTIVLRETKDTLLDEKDFTVRFA